MLNSSSNKLPEQKNRLQPLQQLIYTHPLAFWGGLWVVLVLVSSVATVGLLNPGSIETKEAQQKVALTEVPEFKEEEKEQKSLPISLLGFLTLGCGAGSFVVIQALKKSTKSSNSGARDTNFSVPRKKYFDSRPKRRRKVLKRQWSVPPSKITSQFQDYPEPTQTNPIAEITVLSPQESHPLDSQESGLAEMMDLRKHQSLSSLMRGE